MRGAGGCPFATAPDDLSDPVVWRPELTAVTVILDAAPDGFETAAPVDPRALGAAHPRNAPYQAFTASDGNFVLAAGNDRLWRSVCEVVGRLDLFEEPRFRSTIDRAAHQKELAVILNGEFARETVESILEKLKRVGVPCSSINTYSQALADPQVAFMGWVHDLQLPNDVKTRTFGSPIRINGQTPASYRRPPALDEQGDSIVESLPAAAE